MKGADGIARALYVTATSKRVVVVRSSYSNYSRPSDPEPAPRGVSTAKDEYRKLSGDLDTSNFKLPAYYYVVIAAASDEEHATIETARLMKNYNDILRDIKFSIRLVAEGRDTRVYRVLGGPLPTQEAAYNLCDNLKKAGLSFCQVRSD